MVTAFGNFEGLPERKLEDDSPADAEVVAFGERQLAGAIGSASAQIMVASGVHGIGKMMQIVAEVSQIIEYSRQLEEKSDQLEQHKLNQTLIA